MEVTGADRDRYRVSRTPHLTGLITDAERLATLVADAPPEDRARLAQTRRVEEATATLVLDAVPGDEIPGPDAAEQTVAAASPTGPEREGTSATGLGATTGAAVGTWLDALHAVDDPADVVVRALELRGALAGLASDDLAKLVSTDLASTLVELHRRLTRGLVAKAGALRTREQAVVDGSTGRIIYFPAPPLSARHQLPLLASWLATDGSDSDHPLVASGIVHLELLRLHPFEVANGRLARIAASLVLRAHRFDPEGLAAPSVSLARDPLGYHEEVARSGHRRDLSIACERWAEAVTDGLRRAARELAVVATTPPDRAERFVAVQEGADFTIADYRADAGVTAADAHNDLRSLLDAGHVERIPGSRGLRFSPARA